VIIAIDGPSGTGKGTVARLLAHRLGWVYFDTGAMYRAITYECLSHGVAVDDEKGMRALLEAFDFHISDGNRYFVGSEEVTEVIRSLEVTQMASAVSAIPWVREALVRVQRQFGGHCNAIFEGRDIGTVVFPEAEVKIFLTARPDIRARRRYAELLSKGVAVTLEQVLLDMERRDCADSTRDHSPLCQAEDAHLIDTSNLTIDEAVTAIEKMVRLRRDQ
jgi:CMP/dCMP kinase